MTERRAAPWRHPALAPVYAVVVAFGVVALAGLFVDAQVQVTVTVSAAAGTELPDDLSVEIRDGDRSTMAERGENSWSAVVVAGDHEVCVRSAAPVRVAGTESRCAPTSTTGTTALTVEPVRVIAEVDGERGVRPTGATVAILDGSGRPVDNGALDRAGQFAPRVLPEPGEVCLTPPAGWAVVGAGPGEPSCKPVNNPSADVEFPLETS